MFFSKLHISNRENIFYFLYVNLAYATIYFSPGIPHGGQSPLLFLFFLSLPLLASKSCYKDLNKLFLLSFCLMFFAAIPLALKSGEGEALDAPSRFMIMATVFTAMHRVHFTPKWALRSAMLACIVATGVYCFEIISASTRRIHRVGLGIGILESAYTLTMMLFACIAAISIEKNKIWKAIGFATAVAAIVVIIQTGTRGAWLAALITGFVYLRLISPKSFWKSALLIGVSFSVTLFLSYNLSSTVSKRIDTSLTELQLFGNLERPTSTNRRIIYWEQALDGFMTNPLTGLSYQENAQLRQEYSQKYNVKLTGTDDGRSSSHNEILNAMVQKGIIGLTAILLVYILPLAHFLTKLKSTYPTIRYYATVGVCTVSVIVISGLTEAPLMHTSVSVTYGMLLILLYHAIRNQELSEQKEQSCSP